MVPQTTRHESNLGLDIVRSLAVLAVLFSHTAPWFLGFTRQTEIDSAYIGFAGVEVFFSLSGFLIGGILIRALDRGLTARTLLRFWVRRWMRTLPAYWVLVIGLCLWFGVADGRSPFFLQNFVPRTQWAPLTPHTWSLVLEEWFYLFVPLALFVLAKLIRQQGRLWFVPGLCLTLLIACTLARHWAVADPAPAWAPGLWGADPTINPFLQLDCAVWGVMAAWIIQKTPARNGIKTPYAVTALASGTALLIALAFVFRATFAPESLARWNYPLWAEAWQIGHGSAIQCAAALAIIGIRQLVPSGFRIVTAIAGTIARLSYALYLVHVPVIYLARLYGLDSDLGWPERVKVSLMILLAALLMRHMVERPVLWARDRLAPERQAAADMHSEQPAR